MKKRYMILAIMVTAVLVIAVTALNVKFLRIQVHRMTCRSEHLRKSPNFRCWKRSGM